MSEMKRHFNLGYILNFIISSKFSKKQKSLFLWWACYIKIRFSFGFDLGVYKKHWNYKQEKNLKMKLSSRGWLYLSDSHW